MTKYALQISSEVSFEISLCIFNFEEYFSSSEAFFFLFDNIDLVILKDPEYYFIVAGKKSIVEDVINMKIEKAKNIFKNDYINQEGWQSYTKDMLVKVYNRY